MFHAFTFFFFFFTLANLVDCGEGNVDNLVCPVIHVYNDLINNLKIFFFDYLFTGCLSVKLVSLLWRVK